MEQLLARIHAVARRVVKPGGEVRRIRYGDLELNTDDYTVHERGRRVHLTRKEYEILHLLLSHPGKVLTKEKIFSAVWGDAVHLEEGALAVHIKAIRDKLEGNYICNVRGFGYLVSWKENGGQALS
jgi:DNA-binding response OmpR family regulator